MYPFIAIFSRPRPHSTIESETEEVLVIESCQVCTNDNSLMPGFLYITKVGNIESHFVKNFTYQKPFRGSPEEWLQIKGPKLESVDLTALKQETE